MRRRQVEVVVPARDNIVDDEADEAGYESVDAEEHEVDATFDVNDEYVLLILILHLTDISLIIEFAMMAMTCKLFLSFCWFAY